MDKPDFEKAAEVFKGDPIRQEVVRNMEETYRRAAIKTNLYEHAGIKAIVETITKFMQDDQVKLRDQNVRDYDTPEKFFLDRVKIQTRIEDWQWFLNLFTDAEKTAAQIAAGVNQITQT